MANDDEPFLSRWSRLKRGVATEAKKPSDTEAEERKPDIAGQPAQAEFSNEMARSGASGEAEARSEPERPTLDLENIDFDKLDSTSDYKPFMSADVPDEVRNKALNKLWLSDPVLSAPDQLSDYMDDFTDAARAVPTGLLRTAYKVGQGFLSDDEAAEWDRLGRTEPKASPPEAAPELIVRTETPDQPDVAAFMAASDAYAESLYPPESNHLTDLAALMAPNVHFFVARRGETALGCGALIAEEDGSGEVKRMWVAPEARGQGVGRRLLDAIESAAREKGLTVLRLETGIKQPEAIGLYRKCGFTECEPFGSYLADPLSLFMEKRLT